MHSLLRDSINISKLKYLALEIAGNAKIYSDCYLAIDFLLGSLRPYGDEHSFFMSPEEVKNWKNEGSQVSKIRFSTAKIMDGCGYILVPPFHGGNPKQMLAFADSLQKQIQFLSNAGIKGWILDLQENTGGNMEPMIAGLGPLFSSEKLGSLIDVNKQPDSWYYKNGKYYGDDYRGWNVTHPVHFDSKLPIALLTNNQTGSSGEAVVVSFIGNANTKRFGQSTWGLTTGNGSFDLEDGSKIFLASTIMSDRNGKEYTGSIPPDVDLTGKTQEEVIQAAVKWIDSFH
jgi:C-terminal processing protease CtpA/Prc